MYAAVSNVRSGALLSLSCAALLGVSGCVAVIGNESSDNSTSGPNQRVRLTDSELRELPAITTTADLPTIETRHAAQLAQLSPETTLEQFKSLFPSASFAERRETGGTPVDAYVVRIEEKFRYRGRDYGYMARDTRWFYFKNNKLVKNGAPGAWPE